MNELTEINTLGSDTRASAAKVLAWQHRHLVFIMSFSKSQFPYKYVNLSFITAKVDGFVREMTLVKRLYKHVM